MGGCRRVKEHCRRSSSPGRKPCRRGGSPGGIVRSHTRPKGCRSRVVLVENRVWIEEDVFRAMDLEAILTTPVASSGKRGKKEFDLRELVEAGIASNERGVPMGNAARLVDIGCILPRERRTRWDLKLTPRWVSEMRSSNPAFDTACAITESIECGVNVDWHVQLVFPGSPDQVVHADHQRAKCYYTVLVPLVDNPRAGGTFFPKLDRTFASYGSAVVFDGTVEHAGLGNRSQQYRYFLYAAVYTGRDPNCQ